MKSENERIAPTIDDIYLMTPLYSPIDLSQLSPEERISYVEAMKRPEHPIDMHCAECKKPSTFVGREIRATTLIDDDEWSDHRLFGVEFTCTRDSAHLVHYLFRYIDPMVVKIGQHPSLFDLAELEIEQYRPVLAKERLRELSRAIGLASHGIGVGAFVYLRRIFEDLIEEAHQQALVEASWDEQGYQASKTDDRVQMLKEHLPLFLVENRQLYSVLSKGIHSLTEEECLQHFDVVRVGIELILDEKLQKKQQQDKIRRAQLAVSKVIQELKRGN